MANDANAHSQQKTDWLCKSCKGRDGKPFRNRGFRVQCHSCGLSKGACFGQKVAQASPSVSSKDKSALASRDRELEAKAKEIRELKAKLKASDTSRPRDSSVKSEASGEAADKDDGVAKEIATVRASIKFLEAIPVEHRSLLPNFDEQVAAKKAECKQLDERKRNARPLVERVKQSQQHQNRCQDLVEKHS